MQTAIDPQLEQLERDGYTVFKAFLDPATTARVRAHMDELLPPIPPLENENAHRLQDLRHPIPGAIMAELLNRPELLDLARTLLGANEMRLLEQVLIRTDGQGKSTGAYGWHVDMPFLPEHYAARPRQTYFHMVHALNTVPPGGGAFTVIPGSHHLTFAAAARLTEELGADEALSRLQRDVVQEAGIDLSQAVEVLAEDGDLLVFNPMTLHAPSHNSTNVSRYVYFASFFDASAVYLQDRLNKMKYRDNFPASLRDNLPPELRSLLD